MSFWLDNLRQSASKPSRIVVGLMSGTSMDSIDAAVCEITGGGIIRSGNRETRTVLLYFHKHPYERHTAKRLQDISKAGAKDLSELNVAIGRLFAEACIESIHGAKIAASEVDLVGSHGQTVFHHSGNSSFKSTLQLGDGDVIAEITGLPVISDFRSRDIAAGGEGAPLTPYADMIMFGGNPDPIKRRAVLNLGGIANMTVFHSDASKVLGFDTGPANAPLDRLANILSGGKNSRDDDGSISRAGKINQQLLQKLLNEDKFLTRRPPKSTGLEVYGDGFVSRLIDQHGKADADLLSTATEFVAVSVSKAVKDFVPGATLSEIILAGGGTKNSYLVERLKHNLPGILFKRSDDYGIPAEARECVAFAILANDALLGFSTNFPSVTGALHGVTLGKLSFPRL